MTVPSPLFTQELGDIAEQVCRSTVQVRAGRNGGGSGVIWRSNGLIVTNAHVARGSATTVELTEGWTLEAQVVSRDDRRDLAALQVDATELPAAVIGDSDALRVGQLVLAVGNPLGMIGALTTGIIHALAKDGSGPWVQADVRLAPGNSGGPLTDVQGRVIGINAMVNGGLGLAVPSNSVQRFLGRTAGRPHLGVTLQPVPIGTPAGQVPAMLIIEVAAGSPAERAGLIVGDIIIGLGGRLFSDPRDVLVAFESIVDRPAVVLDLLRGGRRIEREVIVTGGEEAVTGEAA